jgi:hypothetical protein
MLIILPMRKLSVKETLVGKASLQVYLLGQWTSIFDNEFDIVVKI